LKKINTFIFGAWSFLLVTFGLHLVGVGGEAKAL
jgi:hypothetical protein